MRRISVETVVALLAVTVLLMVGLETMQLVAQYSTLSDVRTAQQPSLAEIANVHTQLDALAGETARLAAAGNVNARAVVDEMQRQGITLRRPANAQ